MQKQKLTNIFLVCLGLWTTFFLVDFIENRNFICRDYQGDCCHDGKIEPLDKLFCKLHFRQIEYLLLLFPQNSSRCWEAMADYTSREYSEKKHIHTATLKDEKRALYYLDQAIKYNPEDIDLLSWKANFLNCTERIKYNEQIITLFKNNSSPLKEQLVENIYYDMVFCLRELRKTNSEIWKKDFEDFCQERKAEDSISVCESLLNHLGKIKKGGKNE